MAKSRDETKRPSVESSGLAEDSAPMLAPLEKAIEWVKVGPGGRVVIPARLRRALDIKEGDHVQLRLEGEELHVVSKGVAIRRIQDLVAEFVPPGVSLVDELIEERKREFEAEERGE